MDLKILKGYLNNCYRFWALINYTENDTNKKILTPIKVKGYVEKSGLTIK